jgi:hypothetical protein
MEWVKIRNKALSPVLLTLVNRLSQVSTQSCEYLGEFSEKFEIAPKGYSGPEETDS